MQGGGWLNWLCMTHRSLPSPALYVTTLRWSSPLSDSGVARQGQETKLGRVVKKGKAKNFMES